MIHSVLSGYSIESGDCIICPFGSGLINNTWNITCKGHQYILQRINHSIFKHPEFIDENINKISAFLQQHTPDYLFTTPLKNKEGKSLVITENGDYFRMFDFVANSLTYDVVNTPELAFEAAKQFGKFTKLLSGLQVTDLKITLPDFHNLTLRYNQFITAIEHADKTRLNESKECIAELLGQKSVADKYLEILANPDFRKRVMHHDTKISNVLFDHQGKGICVIDLDTVMPGYFISDVGDMVRTYVCPVNEEENDFDKITIRMDYFKAIIHGYLSEMQSTLTKSEISHFFYAGQFMIYMQALRFLTDHLNNDVYYGARYEGHNLFRAWNQTILLRKLNEKEQEIIKLY